jgi:hypothetical protein
MSRRREHRTQPCDADQARAKLQRAEKFLEVAEFITDEVEPNADFVSAAAALAVLAGISASDAATCKALGRRSRGESHHDAETLLEQISPGGDDAAKALRRLVNLKDQAHYGFYDVSKKDLAQLTRQATNVLAFAREVLSR